MSLLAVVLSELSGRGALARVARAIARRREVAQLRSWDDHALADIGLTRDAVDAALMGSVTRDPSATLCELAGRAPRAAAARRASGRDGGHPAALGSGCAA